MAYSIRPYFLRRKEEDSGIRQSEIRMAMNNELLERVKAVTTVEGESDI